MFAVEGMCKRQLVFCMRYWVFPNPWILHTDGEEFRAMEASKEVSGLFTACRQRLC